MNCLGLQHMKESLRAFQNLEGQKKKKNDVEKKAEKARQRKKQISKEKVHKKANKENFLYDQFGMTKKK